MKTKYNAENELLAIDSDINYNKNLRTITSKTNRSIVHYTSIITLLKILQCKCWKFNRIDNVNDLIEKDSLLVHQNYRRVFVSCFSKTASDRIPMWKMYTNKQDGIMIKIILQDGFDYSDLFQHDFAYSGDIKIGMDMKTVAQSTEKEWFANFDAVDVIYSNNFDDYWPVMKIPQENKVYDIPNNFGRQKDPAWKYEEEFRFRIIMRPCVNHDIELPEYMALYLAINFDAIKKIIITFSPNIDKADWEDVIEMYKEKQGIKTIFTYKNSRLFGKVKLY